MNICVVGTGYVGLVTGACLADFGVQVVCVDKDAARSIASAEGEIPIYEPGLAPWSNEHGGGPAHLHHRPRTAIEVARWSSSPSARRRSEDGCADLAVHPRGGASRSAST